MKYYYSLAFTTMSLPAITTELANVFLYFTNLHSSGLPSKIVPFNIYDLLTPLALAVFIMADGSLHPSGLVLCTENLSVSDVVRLMNALRVRYGFNPSIHCKEISTGRGVRIYIPAVDMNLLRSIV